jgi:acetolactate synthase-1/2/3 large subunit
MAIMRRMTTMSGGRAVVEAMRRAGITRAFGVPGESFLAVLDAFYETPIAFVSTRHEGGAAFMASGYAKTSGEIGVCMGTRAVGSSNLAIGIHTARQDSTAMLAVAGQVNRDFLGREAFQELDLVAVFSQYCKWAVQIEDAARVPEQMARAIRIATTGRPGPVLIALPEDMLRDTADMTFGEVRPAAPATPDPAALDESLKALLGAERPLVLAGGGVLASPGAYEALLRLAEAAELPVQVAWRRHDAFPNDHRLFLGMAGLGAAPVIFERLAAADVVLAVGTRFQEFTTRGYSLPRRAARVYHVDIEPAVLGAAMPVTLGIAADAGVALRALAERLPSPVPGVAVRRAGNDADRAAFVEATTRRPGSVPKGCVDPGAVVAAMQRLLPPEAIVATDAGNFYGWLSRYYRFRRPRTFVGPTSGAMGYGLPAAIGAKLARPDLSVVAWAGDGGFLMTMTELETAVRTGANVVAIVFDNARYGTIRMHQERTYPGRVVATDLTTPDLAKAAEAFGAAGFRVSADAEIEDALAAALSAGKPAVIHVPVDPEWLSVGQVPGGVRS